MTSPFRQRPPAPDAASSPFQQSAPALRLKGYSVLPLREKKKIPFLERWQRHCDEAADPATFDQWMRWPGCNVGVCLGAASGVTALDFDEDVDGLHKTVLRLVGESPVKKAGKRGFTAFYRFGNERSASYNAGGVRVLDVLASGRQTVMPPSVHPEGMPYRWLTERTLENTPPSELPPITPAAMVEVMRLFRTEPAVVKPFYRERSFDFESTDDVTEALGYLPADDYDLWIRIGMALKEGKGEAGYALWDAWSATSAKYKGPQETRKKWASFKGQGVHIETLFWNAMERGYRPPPLLLIPAEGVVTPGGNLSNPVIAEKKTPDETGIGDDDLAAPAKNPPQRGRADNLEAERLRADEQAILSNPPGLVGLIAEHINATAMYPLPLLSLAAGIALAGAVMANKVESPTGLRTNFYTLGVAVSSSGKDHPRKICKEILNAAGLADVEIGVPKSGAGLLSGIRKANNAGIIFLDEFGKYMATITGGKAASHEAEISRLMMEMFTSAGSTFSGMEYADHDGKMPRQVIVNPCLSMFPVTTPERFYDAMTKRDAVDGFIARFLVFEVEDYPVLPVEPRRQMREVPNSLRAEVERWKNRGVNADPASNMGEYYASPGVLPWSPAAKAMMTQYMCETRRRWDEHRREKTGLHAIYGRMAEQAMKLALVAHEGADVSAGVAEWAIKTATFCGERMARLVQQNVADNDQERNAKDVLRIIGELCHASPSGLASHSDLVLRTTRLKRQERRDLIEDAIVSGKVIQCEIDNGKTGPKPVFYKLSDG